MRVYEIHVINDRARKALVNGYEKLKAGMSKLCDFAESALKPLVDEWDDDEDQEGRCRRTRERIDIPAYARDAFAASREYEESREWVEIILGHLTCPSRQTLEEFEIEGFSIEEISDEYQKLEDRIDALVNCIDKAREILEQLRDALGREDECGFDEGDHDVFEEYYYELQDALEEYDCDWSRAIEQLDLCIVGLGG